VCLDERELYNDKTGARRRLWRRDVYSKEYRWDIVSHCYATSYRSISNASLCFNFNTNACTLYIFLYFVYDSIINININILNEHEYCDVGELRSPESILCIYN